MPPLERLRPLALGLELRLAPPDRELDDDDGDPLPDERDLLPDDERDLVPDDDERAPDELRRRVLADERSRSAASSSLSSSPC